MHIGIDLDPSLVEISKTKNKFYIVTYNSGDSQYNVIEMFRVQGKKLLYACEQSFTKLISLLEYRYGKLFIKDMDTMI